MVWGEMELYWLGDRVMWSTDDLHGCGWVEEIEVKSRDDVGCAGGGVKRG